MKIAMIGQKGLPAIWGGVERHVENLSTRLVQNGHQVTVYCRCWYSAPPCPTQVEAGPPKQTGEASWKRPKYQGLPRRQAGVILRFVPSIHTKHLDAFSHTFLATLDALRQDFDVIHYHGVGPALLSWLPRIFKPRAKVVVTFHCLDRLHGKWGFLAKLILHLGEWCACRFPHQTIVVSQTLKKYVEKKYHCPAIYIPNGIEIAKTVSDQSLKTFGLEKNKYLLAVSRLISHKAIHYLIKDFSRLKKNQPALAKDLKLAVVGEGSFTDDYVRYLHQISRHLPEVVFTGWQTGQNLAELMANALFFVHPSQSEGLPLAALEAMSYGQAVIASNIPEHQEIIRDQRFLFSRPDVKSGSRLKRRDDQIADLEKKIIWALKNPEILKVAGIQNRRLVEKEYRWDEIVDLTESLYQQLVLSSADNMPVFTVKRLGLEAN